MMTLRQKNVDERMVVCALRQINTCVEISFACVEENSKMINSVAVPLSLFRQREEYTWTLYTA